MLPVWRRASLFDMASPAFSLLRALEASERGVGVRERLREEDDRFVLTVTVPGLKREELELNVTAHNLTLKGERSLSTPEGFKPVRRERSAIRVHRQFRFRRPLSPEAVEASLKDGVLTVSLPKAGAAESRRVQITAETPAVAADEAGAGEE